MSKESYTIRINPPQPSTNTTNTMNTTNTTQQPYTIHVTVPPKYNNPWNTFS